MPRFPLVLAAIFLVAAAVAADGAATRRCTAATTFALYAIPSGYENDTKDVFLRGVPRGARNVRLRFVRATDGKPVGATAFPLQTWAATVRGHTADGLLWVQITLSGSGYGMPVSKLTRWRMTAAYDC